MRTTIELSNVHNVVLVLEDGGFVVVDVEVVGRGEDRHNRWESCSLCLSVHTISIVEEESAREWEEEERERETYPASCAS